MKKIISLLLILTLALLSLTACLGGDSSYDENPSDEITLRIGYMSGPTGMGMAKLIHDNGGVDGNDKYSFVSYNNLVTQLTK